MDEPINIQKLVQQIYAPPHDYSGWRFEDLIGHSHIRYLRLGRHAFFRALEGLGVRKDDTVLLPAFICKELVSAVHALKAKPAYYEVNRRLEITTPVSALPLAKAILAVNFFGFPQDLAAFRQYCERTGAFLIEDNAHGLFGQDEEGRVLGTRGDVGIFSPRKSLDIMEGAVLTINRPGLVSRFDLATEFVVPSEPLVRRVKGMFRTSVPYVGIGLVRSFILANRFTRILRTGHAIPSSQMESEFELPQDDRAPADLPELFAHIDVKEEILRRRNLYQWLDDSLEPFRVEAVFEYLPEKVVPYGYPMRLNEEQVPTIKKWLNTHGLECFLWPDLPIEVRAIAPTWYRQIWSVQFLW